MNDAVAANFEVREAHALRIAQVAVKKYTPFRELPGRDIAGILMVGYRRRIETRGVNQHEADFMLLNDLRQISIALRPLLFPRLDIGELRLAVIMHLAFVLGIDKVRAMNGFWAALKLKDFDRAADEMLLSDWPDNVGHDATDKQRAIDLVRIMRTGVDRRRPGATA